MIFHWPQYFLSNVWHNSVVENLLATIANYNRWKKENLLNIVSWKKNITVVWVTHSKHSVQFFCSIHAYFQGLKINLLNILKWKYSFYFLKALNLIYFIFFFIWNIIWTSSTRFHEIKYYSINLGSKNRSKV